MAATSWQYEACQTDVVCRHLLHSLQSLQRLNALAWQGSVTGLAAGTGGEGFPEDQQAPLGPSTLMPMQRLGFMSSLRAAVAAMFGQHGRKEGDEEQGLRDALLAPHDCSEDQGGEVSMLRPGSLVLPDLYHCHTSPPPPVLLAEWCHTSKPTCPTRSEAGNCRVGQLSWGFT